MSRRTAAAPDRHALLTGHAYPSSSSVRVVSPAVSEYNTPLRTASPYENPYGDMQGAPKKEASSSGGFVSLFQGSAAQQRSAADLEEQNDTRLNALSERIKMLKDVRRSRLTKISTGIGNEVRESTSEMNSLVRERYNPERCILQRIRPAWLHILADERHGAASKGLVL